MKAQTKNLATSAGFGELVEAVEALERRVAALEAAPAVEADVSPPPPAKKPPAKKRPAKE